jgi:hypothetical protein
MVTHAMLSSGLSIWFNLNPDWNAHVAITTGGF